MGVISWVCGAALPLICGYYDLRLFVYLEIIRWNRIIEMFSQPMKLLQFAVLWLLVWLTVLPPPVGQPAIDSFPDPPSRDRQRDETRSDPIKLSFLFVFCGNSVTGLSNASADQSFIVVVRWMGRTDGVTLWATSSFAPPWQTNV